MKDRNVFSFARSVRFERTTRGLEGRCSIQLSYERIFFNECPEPDLNRQDLWSAHFKCAVVTYFTIRAYGGYYDPPPWVCVSAETLAATAHLDWDDLSLES